MRIWRFIFSLALSFTVFLLAFSAGSIDASAALAGGRYLTPTEALQVFGSEIPAKYYNGSGYTDVTFRYQSTVTISSFDSPDNTSEYLANGRTLLYYRVDGSPRPNSSIDYVTFDITPTYSLFDTTQIHSIIGLSTSNQTGISSVYQSPQWRWYIAGTSYVFENSDLSSSGTHSFFKVNTSSQITYTYVPIDFSSQSTVSGYSYNACFYGNSYNTVNSFALVIGCPYVSSDSTAESGTFTTASGGSSGGVGDINVTVDVDMTETNGLLGSIADLLSGLLSGIQSLFVPDSDFVQSWVLSVRNLLLEVFGSYGSASAMLDQAFSTLVSGSAVESVYFPAIKIPNITSEGGEYVLYAGGNVSLLPAETNFTVDQNIFGTARFYDYMKYIIDIVATMMFVNMISTRFKAMLVGEAVVEVEGDDD